jgi:hypothetical protein
MNWPAKAAIFEKSYDEVLTALKHQDDKLNRTLTAIAFLTAAGVTLFANLAVKIAPPVRFPESAWNVTSFFFLTFLGGVVFALIVALAAIGPSQALPRLQKGDRPRERQQSLLFWANIVNDLRWSELIDRDDAWLQRLLARNLHEETQTISHRIAYKVARSRESGAFVQLAVLSLCLLGIFSIEQLSLSTRWWIAATLLSLMLAMPLWDRDQMLRLKFYEREEMRVRALSYGLVLLGCSRVACCCSLLRAGTPTGGRCSTP